MEDKNIVDMIRNDQNSGTKKNWKTFRDKLRLKRAGKAWKSSVPIPESDISMPKNNRMMVRHGSYRYSSEDETDELEGEAIEKQRSTRLLPVETDPEEDENKSHNEEKQGDDQQMSLMSLLSTDGSNYLENAEQEEEEEDHKEEDMGDCNVCSKCKGKHKGDALGPCGHTFCKNCTKEFHVSKGNCPTCNDYILEILDIY
ncbi:uncharacterized protein [Rutidosis leptorrhynchoides]|uniref:uncharacterized protein n=1 Tax=Rutidosis leptorrhynchoides TaxID=125765 RepID=UPI003A991355